MELKSEKLISINGSEITDCEVITGNYHQAIIGEQCCIYTSIYVYIAFVDDKGKVTIIIKCHAREVPVKEQITCTL